MYRNFTFSCHRFGGYTTSVRIEPSFSMRDILDAAIFNLQKHLQSLNLIHLLEDLEQRKAVDGYQIHTPTLAEILDPQRKHDDLPVVICGCQANAALDDTDSDSEDDDQDDDSGFEEDEDPRPLNEQERKSESDSDDSEAGISQDPVQGPEGNRSSGCASEAMSLTLESKMDES
jgi:hypothetical protein